MTRSRIAVALTFALLIVSSYSLKADVRSIRGMVRFDHSADMPWHADRPAEAMYDAVAGDEHLPASLRAAAGDAAPGLITE